MPSNRGMSRRFAPVCVIVAAWLSPAGAAPPRKLGIELATQQASPLDTVTVVGAAQGSVRLVDGAGREYARAPAAARVSLEVGGALGTQRAQLLDDGGHVVDEASFEVDAATRVDDDTGRFGRLFDMAKDTVTVRAPVPESGAPAGGHALRRWRGRDYYLYDTWVLDQANTSKGMAFFSASIRDGVALFRDSQRRDGMIWSFAEPDGVHGGYWDTAYGPLGDVWHDGGLMFVRQPVENHVEYEFVNMLYQAWKARGDDAFLRASLAAAERALDYPLRDPARFSRRFALLKRPYTIDSWDFQVDDAYTVHTGLNPIMTIDPERTKFGVFFGDNTGYVQACQRLAEMLAHAGRHDEAAGLRERARTFAERLTALSWNGRFFRHFIDEDPSVKRDLGVDEAAQIAQGNAYSLNRGIAHEQAVAILRTYQELRKHLPQGSPGEWYAIYPPFGRGFAGEGETWQYMNGGVAGHAAGELARGAFAHGFEAYGVSVLERSAKLAEQTDRQIHFAYTGAFPDPPEPPRFSPVSLKAVANMDTRAPSPGKAWMESEPGNDLARLPPGELKAGGAPFTVLDPRKNEGRAAVAVAARSGFAREVELPLGQRAGALYLLHAVQRSPHRPAKRGAEEDVAAGLTFRYQDGSERGLYLRRGVHVAGWWFPELSAPNAGVAWRGANAKTGDVGLTWAAIENPEPDKVIQSLVVHASLDGSVYALAALTCADHMPYHPPSRISYGGPDNWAGANMIAALIEGLAGIVDTDRAYGTAQISPRWVAAGARRASVTARYGASQGYVAYRFDHDPGARRVTLTLTGSGESWRARLLLPPGKNLAGVALDGAPVEPQMVAVESSRYAELTIAGGLHRVQLTYR